MLDTELGIEEAQEVIDLCDGACGGFSTASGDTLLDGNGGRESCDAVDIRLF